MRFIGNVEKDAQVRAVASGALSTGDTVIVNSDGTVSVVEGTDVSQSIGTAVVFENAYCRYISATYDASAQKVVIAYRDDGNSDYGTAIVGTVSGTSISFGSPVVFESANSQWVLATYDANAAKIVIAYYDGGNSGYGTAVVGTVSGTSISFGSPVVFESATSVNISATYDANAQKVVIAYVDVGNSSYGTAIVGTVSGTSISFGSPVVFDAGTTSNVKATFDSLNSRVVVFYSDLDNAYYGTAVVGTVSGTSISFGSPVVFESARCNYVSSAYDSGSSKLVVTYQDAGNSDYGTAIVGTVSGTSISFGPPVVFKSSQSADISVTYDANAQKVVVAYRDGVGLDYGTVVAGSVSGTSISFDDPVVFESARSDFMSTVYDPNAQKVVVAYKDSGNSDYGTAAVFQAAYKSTTLTSENFLGFAAHTCADTQSAVINSTCTVDRNQSGLTAGQTYYVQTDGTLGTTAADPSVEAGTAISSTEIIVKG